MQLVDPHVSVDVEGNQSLRRSNQLQSICNSCIQLIINGRNQMLSHHHAHTISLVYCPNASISERLILMSLHFLLETMLVCSYHQLCNTVKAYQPPRDPREAVVSQAGDKLVVHIPSTLGHFWTALTPERSLPSA